MDMRLESDGDLHVDNDVIAFSTTTSDERLKTDISTVENALEKLTSNINIISENITTARKLEVIT